MAARRTRKAGTVYQGRKVLPTERCMICGVLIKLHIQPCWKITSPATNKGSSNDK